MCQCGASEISPDNDDVLSALSRADQALYDAKNSGRNRVYSKKIQR